MIQNILTIDITLANCLQKTFEQILQPRCLNQHQQINLEKINQIISNPEAVSETQHKCCFSSYTLIIIYSMAITSFEEKENRKIWVPIRDGNRGGWSLFDWEKVREMPYRDREMYLGNSAKIGILDKGGKWRKKDWYLKKDKFEEGETLSREQSEVIRKDRERMMAALGMIEKDQEEKLTPAEMQMLLKKIKGNKEQPAELKEDAVGLGFDKLKVQIRSKPAIQRDNPHRLEGNVDANEDKKIKQDDHSLRKRHNHDRQSEDEHKQKKKRKDKTEKRKKDRRDHSEDQDYARNKRDRSRSRSRGKQKKQHKHRHRVRSSHSD